MLETTDTIWRYMKLSTLMLLLEGRVWLPSIASLQAMDPLEGRLGDDFYQNLWDQLEQQGDRDEARAWAYKNLAPQMQNFLKLNRSSQNLSGIVLAEKLSELLAKRRAAWCWYRSNLESAAMWSIYGNQGVAIRSNIEKLTSSFPTSKDKKIYKMIYVNRQFMAKNSLHRLIRDKPETLLRPYLLKAVEYEHEKEVRLVTHCPDDVKRIMISGIDVKNLIQEAVISPIIPLDEAESIKKFLSQHFSELEGKIKQSDLNGRSGPDFADAVTQGLYDATDENMHLSEIPAVLRTL